MKLSENIIRGLADSSTVFSRGKSYFKQGRVLDIRIGEHKEIIAKVRGSEDYEVIIYPPENGDYEDIDAECSCPYPGYICKHAVATLLALVDLTKSSAKNASSKKVSSIAPFNKLELIDITKGADKKSIFNALQLVKENKVQIALQNHDDLLAHVGKRPSFDVSLCRSPFMREDKIFEECTCYHKDFGKCEHILAVKLALLKNTNKNSISKKFEEQVIQRFNKERYNELQEFLKQQANLDNLQDSRKKEYKLFFSFEKATRGVSLKITKRQMLKNNGLGQASPLRHRFIRENYENFLHEEKELLNAFLTEPSFDYNGYTFYENNTFKSDGLPEESILEMLKKIYLKSPERFENCQFADKTDLNLGMKKILGGFQKGNYQLNPIIQIGEKAVKLNWEDLMLIGKDKIWSFIPSEHSNTRPNDKKNIFVELSNTTPSIKKFIQIIEEVKIPQKELHSFLENSYELISKFGNINFPKEVKFFEATEIKPAPVLYLRDHKDSFSVELKFRYEKKEIPHHHKSEIFFKNEKSEFVKVRRDTEEENKILARLMSESLQEDSGFFIPTVEPLIWLSENLSKISREGFEVYGKERLSNYRLINAEPKLTLEVSSGIDWFDLKTEVSFADKKTSFEKVVSALKNQERFVKLDDGTIGILPAKWFSKLSGVAGLLEKKEEGKWKASSAQIKLIESLLEISDNVKLDKKFEEIKKKFENFSGIKEVSLPKDFKAQLRPYQKAGYDWLYFLREFSFGGCLADEMGLGKTIQALALLQKEREDGQKTSVVVVPKTLLFNWVEEAKKFAPSLNIYMHHGLQRRGGLDKVNSDIILTTYGTLRRDIEIFKKKSFNYIILDESQNIKNPLSKNTKSAYSLKGEHRLTLTGTPVENNYFELWSQLSFLNPGLLGSMDYFKETFVKNINSKNTGDITNSLKNIINPFILMRKKESVAKDLPEKQITSIFCNMEKEQRDFYERWKEKYRIEIKEKIQAEGILKSRFKILEGLLRLRQICNHPKILDQSFNGDSGKFEIMLQKIKEAALSGHKILVFSSFVSLLKLIKHSLNEEKLPFLYMDGKTNNRRQLVEEFQKNPEIKAFLISIKTGGLGLNLTEADYVLIADPWWNPAVEMQAIDRTHRIGQDKKVIVYKLITKDSIEEKILELQNKKMDMVKNVISEDSSIFKQLNAEEIQRLFT